MTDDTSNDFPSAGAVIAAFGGIRPMATRLDVPVSTVQGWKQRDAIPDNRIDQIRAAAAADGIDLAAVPDALGEETAESFASDTAAPAEAEAPEPPPATDDGPHGATPAAPAAAGPPPRGGGAMAVALLALVVAGAAAGWLLWSQQQPADGGADRIARLEGEMATLDRARRDIAALRAEIARLADRPVAPPADPARMSALERRVDDLAGRFENVTASSPDEARLDGVESDIDDLKAAVSASTAAMSSLRTGVDNTMSDLSGRLVAVEKREGSADATAARAVGLAIAAAELRDALRGGAPFTADLATLRELASDDAALAPHIATLDASAKTGLTTRAALTRRFDGLVGDILAADRAPGDAPWYEKALDRAADIVSIRRIGGDASGASTDAIVARTEARLTDGDLAGAVGEAATLQGEAAAVAAPWLAQARIVLAAEAAVAAINAKALATLAGSRGG